MFDFLRRIVLTFFLPLIVVPFFSLSFSQVDYTMSILNGEKVNSKTIEFDVYIKSNSGNFILSSYQCAIKFSQNIINGGSLSFSYIPNTTDLQNLPPLSAVGILNEQGVNTLTFGSVQPINREIITTAQTRVGRFRLSNPQIFSGNNFSLKWDFDGNIKTILTGLFFSNITNPNNHVNFITGETFTLTVSIQNGWNMLSIPGWHPIDQNVKTWWINKDPLANVFRFSGGYQPVMNLEPGVGYLMKHFGNQVYNSGDEWPAEGFFYADYNPISVNAGWNIIGCYDYIVNVSAITTSPPGLINGLIYGFTSNTGYQVVNSLVPGYGYWVNMNGAGIVNLPESVIPNGKMISVNNDEFGKIIITDNTNKKYILYVVDNDINLDAYLLPPVIDDEIFDLRFSSGRFAEKLTTGSQTIEIRGFEYPIRVAAENINLKIQDETGMEINQWLNAGSELIINNNNIRKLLVSNNNISDNYILEQNFPNPFNPSTVIKFSLPEAADVTLNIYNVLGQKVSELVNSKLDAGHYSFQWDIEGESIASGMYIYELKSEKFVFTKKMLVIK